jgi:hypothetical protein
MPNLIEELKMLMEEKDLSPEAASHYIECSGRQIYRWLEGKSIPNQIYRRAIRRGINKMKKLPGVSFRSMEKDKELYRKLRKHVKLTMEEKEYLLDSAFNYFDYRRRLHKLAKKYGIDIPASLKK